MISELTHIQAATAFIRQQAPDFQPETGLILGTGLGGLAAEVQVAYAFAYADIPHFPISTAPGHAGRLLLGTLRGRQVAVLQGRFHYYEGYTMAEIVRPLRVLHQLGIRDLLISNAAGGLDPTFAKGDVMLLTDHLNLLPANPLVGPNLAPLGPRFPDMWQAYDADLLAQAHAAAATLGLSARVRAGVYAAVPGPMLETAAEYHYLRLIGADAVGMSTVPEVIAARHLGLRVLAASVITDLCDPTRLGPVSLPEILAVAAEAEPRLTALFAALMRR